jgi:Tol biopolymer transport system component
MKPTPTGKTSYHYRGPVGPAVDGEPQVSPTGPHAVHVRNEIDSERDTYRSQLVLVALDGDSCSPRQLTLGKHRCVPPRWLPDGRLIGGQDGVATNVLAR